MPSLKKCNWKVSVRYPFHLFLHFLYLFKIIIVLCVVNNKIQTHKTYRPKPTASEIWIILYIVFTYSLKFICGIIYIWHFSKSSLVLCILVLFVLVSFSFIYWCFTSVLNTNSFSILGWLRGTERYLSWLFRWNRVFLQNLFNTLHLDNWKQSKRSYK